LLSAVRIAFASLSPASEAAAAIGAAAHDTISTAAKVAFFISLSFL
jgi:hypothetical protein